MSTIEIWKLYGVYLRNQFWNERTFWSDGYFVSSIGNVSEKTIKEYIEKPKLEIEKSNSSTTLKM